MQHANLTVIAAILFVLWQMVRSIRRAKADTTLYIRKIPGVDAIDEAVGRAVELGRPIVFGTGLTSIGPVLYACLGVLYHVVRRAAQLKSRILLPQNAPDVMAVTEEVAREAYKDAKRSQDFDPNSLLYLSDEQFAYAAGYIGMVQREQIGSAFLFGRFAAESLVLAEAGQQVGAMQVAATVSPEQVAFFICTCDYTLIGEELFAASAYLTKEPIQLGSLIAQDRCKLLMFIIILVGVSWASWQSVATAVG